MGVSSVGATPVQRKPIVYPYVEVYSTSATAAQLAAMPNNTRIVPAGWWELQTTFTGRPNGFISSGSTTYTDVHPQWVQFYSVSTGKVTQTVVAGTGYSRTAGPFYVTEDCYIQIISTDTTTSNVSADVTLYPADMPLTFEGSSSLLEASNTTPASANTTLSFTGTMDSGLGFAYDYDNDTLAIISPTTITSTGGGAAQIARTLNVYRKTSSSTTYSPKVALTLANTNNYWNPTYNAGVDIKRGMTEFFIKNNELHVISGTPIYDDGTTISGWVKMDCTSSGTKTFSLGNSNLNFHATKSTFSFLSGQYKSLSYTHDFLSKKVIYLGFHNNAGTDATKWTSYWSQWDIATNTNDFTSSLGAKNRYFGNNSVYSFALDAFAPDAATGRAYGIRMNQSSSPWQVLASAFIRSTNTINANLPTKVYANADEATVVNAQTGATNMRAGGIFYSLAGVTYGSNIVNDDYMRTACPELLTKTTNAELANDITITNGGMSPRFGRILNSGAEFFTGGWGFYFAGSKIYVVNTGIAYSTRNATTAYTGNIFTRVFSMPATEANLSLVTAFRGGIKSATSNYNIH